MGVSFLYPAFLIGALAVAVPIVLHLLRRRTETVVEFPAVRLLHKAPLEQRRRRRLRELILLALRVTALLLLAIAFARPYLANRGLALSSPITVVAIDSSMSLSAPGQIESIRQAATRAVTDAPATHAVAVMTFADSATVLVPVTTDRGAAVTAVDAIAPGPGGTRYRTAFARAAEVLGGRGGRVVVITDLQQVGWEASDEGGLPDGVTLEVIDVRPPSGNLAVTAVRREGANVIASVHNFGGSVARVTARLRVEDRDVSTGRVEVPPQSAADVRFSGSMPATGGASVSIEDATGYHGDNIRYFVLDPPEPLPLAVITADPAGAKSGLYVERALATAGGPGFRVEVVDGRKFGEWPERKVNAQAAVIVLGTQTLERAGRDLLRSFLERGGQVLLTLGPDVDVATVRDAIGVDLGLTPEPVVVPGARATLVAADVRHPIFRPFLGPSGALGDVSIEQYRRLTDRDGRRVLAQFSGGAAALVEEVVGRGRLLVFTSDLDNRWNRFPLNASFVPFALETTRYLTRGRELRQTFVLPDLPPGVPGVPGVVAISPVGARSPQAGSPAEARSAQAGPASSNTSGAETRRVAVNVDVRESNPARTSPDEFSANVPRLQQPAAVQVAAEAREQEDRQRWWQSGLLVMFLALAGEGLIGRKAI
jgi:Aerotolerance regulator N-terminal/von Willebrand factor type A domain